MVRTNFKIGDWVRFKNDPYNRVYRVADITKNGYILNDRSMVDFSDDDLILSRKGRTNASVKDVKNSLMCTCYTDIQKAREYLLRTYRIKHSITAYIDDIMMMSASTKDEAEKETINILEQMIKDIRTREIYK